jgi:putative membrane protein
VLTNPYIETLAFFSVAILALIVFLSLFEFVTKYNNWQEIKKGNIAVALATGGKIFGICNIFRFAITSNESIYSALIWASFGFILLVVAYFIFEFLTPTFRIDEEIKNDNRAVGFISMVISIAFSFVIGASVS